MARSRVLDLCVAVAVLGGVAVAVRLDRSLGFPEFAFGSVVLLALWAVLRLAARAGRRAVDERVRARRLESLPDVEVARYAVRAERARLAADVQAVIRAAATGMRAAAEEAERTWDTDPGPALEAVQKLGERAGLELRRLLGLLRQAEQYAPEPAPPTPGRGVARMGRGDVVLACAVTALAVLEHLTYASAERSGIREDLLAGLLTGAAAASLVLRRAAPGLGAATCGVVFAVSAWTHPISPGFWVIATLGGLAWAAVRGTRAEDAAGLVLLWVGVAVGTAVQDPANLPITLLLLTAATVGGAVVRFSDAWAGSARARADRRTAELDAAIATALHAERLAMARELHDVVSHAVGVMVVQAGAAQATRRVDEGRARRALEVVHRTAADALGELGRLVDVVDDGVFGAAVAPAARGDADLHALVDRLQTAGLDVRLASDCPLSGELASVVYRLVQESLTNVVRHAPGARVDVVVAAGPDDVCVQVLDDGPGPGTTSRRGYGLVGIAERVHGLGGEFTAGPPAAGRGFQVRARLPVAGTSEP